MYCCSIIHCNIEEVILSQQVKIDPEAVRVLAELLKETDLTEIEYQIDSLRIKVQRAMQQTVVSSFHHQESAKSISSTSEYTDKAVEAKSDGLVDHPGIIEAQMVGTVYLSPGPGTKHFISVGSKVSQGETLFIIEAMKVMNMIKAPRSGEVKHIFVKDGQPVEYGDPVLIID